MTPGQAFQISVASLDHGEENTSGLGGFRGLSGPYLKPYTLNPKPPGVIGVYIRVPTKGPIFRGHAMTSECRVSFGALRPPWHPESLLRP